MPEGKRYYWLKLKDDFFSSKRIKKMRRMAGGDTYTIIYLKLQLLAMKNDGIIEWSGLEDTVADELALDLDEAPEDVHVTLMYLLSCGLAETEDNATFFFPYAVENVGSETASAQRVRDFRKREALQCNTNVTQVKRYRNGEIEKEIELENREREKREEIEKEDICTEPQAPPVLTIVLNDGTEYGFSQEYIDKMQSLYPAVDVLQEMRKMQAWCINNPKRRKTRRGITSFVGNWLSKAQDEGGMYKTKGREKQGTTTFMDIYERRMQQSDSRRNCEGADADPG